MRSADPKVDFNVERLILLWVKPMVITFGIGMFTVHWGLTGVLTHAHLLLLTCLSHRLRLRGGLVDSLSGFAQLVASADNDAAGQLVPSMGKDAEGGAGWGGTGREEWSRTLGFVAKTILVFIVHIYTYINCYSYMIQRSAGRCREKMCRRQCRQR